MVKITKKNYKKIIRELKEKNAFVYTERGTKIRAKDANFRLYWNVKGYYSLAATRKK